MNRLKFSAIIPTHDRDEDLARCLGSMLEQDIDPEHYEVIVVNDGGAPTTEQVVESKGARFRENLTYIYQEHKGPAAARNKALEEAQSDILLFLNDDVVFAPGYFAGHLDAHQRQPGHAVRGNTRWHPDVLTTPFMQWVAQSVLFYYLIEDTMSITYEYFHTLDLSIHRRWLEHDRFDESFIEASLEDTELGVRLMKKGLRLQFAPEAVCYHYHYYDLPRHLKKMRINARNSWRVVEQHPELMQRLITYYTKSSSLTTFLDWLSGILGAGKETPRYWQHISEREVSRQLSFHRFPQPRR